MNHSYNELSTILFFNTYKQNLAISILFSRIFRYNFMKSTSYLPMLMVSIRAPLAKTMSLYIQAHEQRMPKLLRRLQRFQWNFAVETFNWVYISYVSETVICHFSGQREYFVSRKNIKKNSVNHQNVMGKIVFRIVIIRDVGLKKRCWIFFNCFLKKINGIYIIFCSFPKY